MNSVQCSVDHIETAPLTLWQMICSVFMAAFGVQNSNIRKRDFTRGDAVRFALVAAGFTGVLVVTMVLVVKVVLAGAGA